jgi:hypothetical protein
MFYLVGVEHGVQSKSKDATETAEQAEYRSSLERAIKAFKPAILAEEFNKDALERAAFVRKAPQEPFTKQIAFEAGISHMFCEPDLYTKLDFGYQGRDGWLHHIDGLWEQVPEPNRSLLAGALEIMKDFPLREELWLNQMKDVLGEEIIFICGDGHIETFAERLAAKKIGSKIVQRQIGMAADLIEKNNRIVEFLRVNSEYVEAQYQKILNENGGTIESPHDPRRRSS